LEKLGSPSCALLFLASQRKVEHKALEIFILKNNKNKKNQNCATGSTLFRLGCTTNFSAKELSARHFGVLIQFSTETPSQMVPSVPSWPRWNSKDGV